MTTPDTRNDQYESDDDYGELLESSVKDSRVHAIVDNPTDAVIAEG